MEKETKNRKYLYVSEDNKYMAMAKEEALAHSTDGNFPTGAVIVKESGEMLAKASNQSAIKNPFLLKTHKNWCFRRLLKIPSGQHYWLCPGCASSDQHAEYRAIQEAKKKNIDVKGCDLYLWGHWWCCESCWRAMIAAGIRNVCLTKNE